MSKTLEATIACPNCRHQFPFRLFRTIWGEDPQNRELVFSDRINVAECPSCKVSAKLVFPFFYTNVVKQFAVWWEPYYDEQIDKDSEGYAKMFGPSNFYTEAPRIKDWEEFKRTIIQFENGILKGNPAKFSPEAHASFMESLKSAAGDGQRKEKKSSGCLGVVLAIWVLIIFGSFVSGGFFW